MSWNSQDQQQVGRLCDDLTERVTTGQIEESLLASLILLMARTRAYQARQYQVLLEAARTRQRRFWELLTRYCRER